jgi:hypothetical protein
VLGLRGALKLNRSVEHGAAARHGRLTAAPGNGAIFTFEKILNISIG